jgi:hypothetical protein
VDVVARPSRPWWRREVAALLVVTLAAEFCVLLAASGLARAAGTKGVTAARVHWGRAESVPGLGALNRGYNADVNALSCWGAGGCVAGGFYADRQHHSQAWVAMERKGRWGKAMEVPGTAALNRGGNAQVGSVSCARTTVCVAVGSYRDENGNVQWFTVNERDGRWGTAAEVPHPALNDAVIGTVWCAPGGLCATGGWYTDPSTGPEAWVMTETHFRWRPALEVPGIAALNVGSYVGVVAVSCASAGNCAAGGQYTSGPCCNNNGTPPLQAFVVTEAGGTWGSAQEVPGTGAINSEDSDASTTLLTCPSAGNCTAAGYYQRTNVYNCDPSSAQPAVPVADQPGPPPSFNCGAAFVVNERHGTWGQATGHEDLAVISSLTCPASGDCVAAGMIDNDVEGPIGDVLSEENDQ